MSERTVTVERVYDEDPDLSWLLQSDAEMGEGFEEQAAERLASFEAGDWHMIGIIVTVTEPDSDTCPHCSKPVRCGIASLWGIESDSEESHLAWQEQELEDEAIYDLENQAFNRRAST